MPFRPVLLAVSYSVLCGLFILLMIGLVGLRVAGLLFSSMFG